MRPIQGKDGKFKGSIGDGAASAPTPSTVPASTSAAGPAVALQPGIDETYQHFRAAGAATPDTATPPTLPALEPDVPVNTFPARYQAYEAASDAYQAAQSAAEQARAAAGGQAIRAGMCAACGHHGHDGRTCSATVQVMSDIWDACGCTTPVAPTDEQIAAADAAQTAHEHYLEMCETRDAAEEYRAGDVITVTRGRKVPRGSTGIVLRTYDGEYGLRVLFRDADGEDVWVAATNVERFLP